jgi:hypothetical protein
MARQGNFSMNLHFRKMDDGGGYLVSLADYEGLEITVLMDDGYRLHALYGWELSVAYELPV